MSASATKPKSKALSPLKFPLAKTKPKAYRAERERFVQECVKYYSLGSTEDFGEFLNAATMAYDGGVLWDKEARRGPEYADTTSELADETTLKSLRKMRMVFNREGNWAALDRILEQARVDDPVCTYPTVEEMPKASDIVWALEVIYANIKRRPPRTKHDRGVKSKNHNLFHLVDDLASYWERNKKGEPFKSPQWGKGKGGRVPITANGSAQFAYTVVYALDPAATKSLKNVMRDVRTARLATSRK